ncbi:MAG: polymerase sigma factor RpoD [Parcubacteria group bacterium]|nr:polymerase sigma factor RpoD [Parcubacteria group bacterium]
MAEGYKPGSSNKAETNEAAQVSPELLSLLGSEDSQAIGQALATLRKEIDEAPIVGRSLTAIRGKELVIPITTVPQKQRVLEALYELGIFPWEEEGMLIVDHHRDMAKLQLTGLTNETPLVEEAVLPQNLETLTFPLERHDTLSEHLKNREEVIRNLPNEERGTPPSRPRMRERDVKDEEMEPGLDTELQDLINRFDQGLIDETDEEFQRKVGVFPTLTLFPRQYIWQKGNPIEKRTGKIITRKERDTMYALAKEGDISALNTLTRMHTGLVIDAVVRAKEKFGGDADDLFQEGMMGMVRSIQLYEQDGKAQFSTYAMYGIEQRIRRFAYQHRFPIVRPVHLKENQRKFRKVSSVEDATASDLPSRVRERLADTFKEGNTTAGYDRLERMYFLNALFDPISDNENNVIDAKGRAQDAFLQNMIDGDIPPATFHRELEEYVKTILLTLSPREERILRLRFGIGDDQENGSGLTLEEIGEKFSVTGSRIREIEAKALRKLKHPSRSRKLRWFIDSAADEPYRYEEWSTRRARWDKERRIRDENMAHIEKMKKSRLPDNLV